MRQRAVDLEKLRGALRRMSRGNLLMVAERAIEIVPKAKLGTLVGDLVGLDQINDGKRDAAPLSRPLDLIVLALKSNALRCRVPGTAREITLRTAVRWEVPGEIITVRPTKQWTYAGHPYLSGKVQRSRLDVRSLGLMPLGLEPGGDWDPAEEYWGEEGEPLDDWAKPIVVRGKRPAFEMEQVLPGANPDDPDIDPIIEASELRAAGERGAAQELLMKVLAEDLRCLDAHAHLGNFEFEHSPKQALRHYMVGTSIGAHTLGTDFDGVLPWGLIDNRPFLRCLHGVGLCFWRLGEMKEAAKTFTRMLWLNPMDNQGARFNLANVRAGRTWDECEGREDRGSRRSAR